MSTHSSDHHTETATVYLSQGESTRGQFHNNPHDCKKYYPPAEVEYEEIAQNPVVFLGKLKGFHESFGIKLKVPTIGGRALDLYRLFLEVTSRGGIEKVIRDRKWKEVISAFNFPATITSASFVLRKYYVSLLYHFEQVYYFRKEVPSFSLDDSASKTTGYNGSAAPYIHEEYGVVENELPDQVSFTLECESSITGTIDAKFDNGYLITVELGDEKLKGVLYHTQISNSSAVPRHRKRKRYQPAMGNPPRPDFLFAEQYTTSLWPSYGGGREMLDFRSPNTPTDQ